MPVNPPLGKMPGGYPHFGSLDKILTPERLEFIRSTPGRMAFVKELSAKMARDRFPGEPGRYVAREPGIAGEE